MRGNTGYFIIPREITQQMIEDRWSPLRRALFLWMWARANYKDTRTLKRGQLFTKISEMQEAMSYHAGYRKVTPTVAKIRNSYEALRNRKLIDITKSTRGMRITIKDYNQYSAYENHEEHNEKHNEDSTKSTTTTHSSKINNIKLKNKKTNARERELWRLSAPPSGEPAPVSATIAQFEETRAMKQKQQDAFNTLPKSLQTHLNGGSLDTLKDVIKDMDNGTINNNTIEHVKAAGVDYYSRRQIELLLQGNELDDREEDKSNTQTT